MTLLTASCYILCLAFLVGSALFVYSQNPHHRLNSYYALLALALVGWVGTLFVFGSLPEGTPLLLVGRANFAAAALVVLASYLFVSELAGTRPPYRRWLWMETLVMVGLSLVTPLIDRAEVVRAGQHLTNYGLLFSGYIFHIVGYLGAAVVTALRPMPRMRKLTRVQLRLVGLGILATAVVGVTTNIVLPYWFGNFHWINLGTLSTILLLGFLTYAVTVYHLFNTQVIIRTTVVYAVVISVALEVYKAAVTFLADLLPLGDPTERHFAAMVITLVINAATQDVLQRWLHRIIGRLLPKTWYRHQPGSKQTELA